MSPSSSRDSAHLGQPASIPATEQAFNDAELRQRVANTRTRSSWASMGYRHQEVHGERIAEAIAGLVDSAAVIGIQARPFPRVPAGSVVAGQIERGLRRKEPLVALEHALDNGPPVGCHPRRPSSM